MTYLSGFREWSAQYTGPAVEALKNVLRPFLFAVATFAVEYILSQLKVAHVDPTVIVVGTSALTWLDSYLHEKAKEKGRMGDALPSGIAPF